MNEQEKAIRALGLGMKVAAADASVKVLEAGEKAIGEKFAADPQKWAAAYVDACTNLAAARARLEALELLSRF